MSSSPCCWFLEAIMPDAQKIYNLIPAFFQPILLCSLANWRVKVWNNREPFYLATSPWMSWQLSLELLNTEEEVKAWWVFWQFVELYGASYFMISKWVYVPLFMKDTGANDILGMYESRCIYLALSVFRFDRVVTLRAYFVYVSAHTTASSETLKATSHVCIHPSDACSMHFCLLGVEMIDLKL